MAKAVAAGGMELVEITWNSHKPASSGESATAGVASMLHRGGTVLSVEEARDAIAAGAMFCISPHTDSRHYSVLPRNGKLLPYPVPLPQTRSLPPGTLGQQQ